MPAGKAGNWSIRARCPGRRGRLRLRIPAWPWAAGTRLRASPRWRFGCRRPGRPSPLRGSRVTDLGVAPDGALWVVADVPVARRSGGVPRRGRASRPPAGRGSRGCGGGRDTGIRTAPACCAARSGWRRVARWSASRRSVAGEHGRGGRRSGRAAGPSRPASAAPGCARSGPAAAAGARPVLTGTAPWWPPAEGRSWVLEGAQGRTLWRRAQP